MHVPTAIDGAWGKDEFVDVLEKLQVLDEVEYAIDFKIPVGASHLVPFVTEYLTPIASLCPISPSRTW